MITAGKINVSVGMSYDLQMEKLQESIFIVKITRIKASEDDSCTVSLKMKAKNIKGVWRPSYDREYSIYNRLAANEPILANFDTPVRCIYDFSEMNVLSIGIDPGNIPALIHSYVMEETGEINVAMEVYGSPDQIIIMLDTERENYCTAIRRVVKWMHSVLNVVNSATVHSHLPVYSTWYSYHQNLSLELLKREIPIAESAGFGTVIIDDGWQTSDNGRGYAYCGDWRPSPSKIPDLRSFTDFIHNHGMRVLLWCALPFIGRESRSFSRFSNNIIRFYSNDVAIADPSNGEYRKFIKMIMEEAVQTWGFDGIKADFIDQFRIKEKEKDPDVMKDNCIIGNNTVQFLNYVFEDYATKGYDIELRQYYFGPLMQRICTMIRAEDCPYDPLENRVRTVNLRLSTFGPAVHSDPISWHEDESVEDIVRYMLNCIHSVLQISVILEKQKSDVMEALKFWLSFSSEHAGSLVYGEIEAGSPSSSYPYVSVTDGKERIITIYDKIVISIPDPSFPVYIINASISTKITILLSYDVTVNAEYFNCKGKLSKAEKMELKCGINTLNIDMSGYLKIYY